LKPFGLTSVDLPAVAPAFVDDDRPQARFDQFGWPRARRPARRR
jgi:hypothetical protein